MSSRRMITSDIWEDDFITSLNIFDRLLWIGLITGCADDQGRLQDSTTLIRSRIFPLDDVPINNIEAGLNRFQIAGKIERYIVGNKRLIQIVHWWKHQTPRWAGKSNYPPPLNWMDRERYHATGNELVERNWKSVGGYLAGYTAPHTIRDVKEEVNVNDDVKDEESRVQPPQPPLNIFSIYQNEIGVISKMVADELTEAEKHYPAEWFVDAIREAVNHNARNWKYVKAILKRWKVEGRSNGNGSKPPPQEYHGKIIYSDGIIDEA